MNHPTGAVAQSVDDPTVDALVEFCTRVRGDHDDWDEYRRSLVAVRRVVLRLTPVGACGMLGS